MEIVLYAIIFVMGCFFGSFFTLAVYRIPRKEDILIKHSYCPNCNHKLGFLDLFPVLSYIFLKGKCRYCKEKIRPRYFILEIFSGIVFLLMAISLKIDIYNVNFVEIFLYFIYISVLFIIAGIDKEFIKIENSVLLFGFGFEFIYIIYQCILSKISIYKYVIYLVLLIILLIIKIINLRKNMKSKYQIEILFLSLYMIIFTGRIVYILTVILTLLTIAIYRILNKEKDKKLPIGFFLIVSNIIINIASNYICNYIM